MDDALAGIRSMDRILVDTSALYALVDRNDEHHSQAAKILASLLPYAPQLVVPNFLLAESHTIINRRVGPREALRFLKGALLDYQIERVTVEDEQRALCHASTHFCFQGLQLF